jgi:hypothetical protein
VPAIHPTHTEAVVAPTAEDHLPATQLMQLVAPMILDQVPAAQDKQEAWLDDPLEVEKVPAVHETHTDDDVAAEVADHVPVTHPLQIEAPETDDHVPEGQAWQAVIDVCPGIDQVPALHALHAAIDVAETAADQNPPGQSWHWSSVRAP